MTMSLVEYQCDSFRTITHIVFELPINWLELTTYLEYRLDSYNTGSLAAPTNLAELGAEVDSMPAASLLVSTSCMITEFS